MCVQVCVHMLCVNFYACKHKNRCTCMHTCASVCVCMLYVHTYVLVCIYVWGTGTWINNSMCVLCLWVFITSFTHVCGMHELQISLQMSFSLISLEKMVGYEARFVEPLLKGHECPICLLAMRNPVQTECGHLFCRVCMEQVLSSSQTVCPVDKTIVTERMVRLCTLF